METIFAGGFLALAFFWFVIAIWTAALAGRKRDSIWAWFVVGLLFGPIAFLYVMAMPMGGPLCDLCGEPHDKRAKVCPHCQREISKDAAAPTAKGFKSCPACHRPARGHMLACPACGESLVDVPVAP